MGFRPHDGWADALHAGRAVEGDEGAAEADGHVDGGRIAADEQAAAARREEAAHSGGAFGLPAEDKNFELPDEFKKFMG